MAKLNIQKLATTLSGKERAKLMISDWHGAIIHKETLNKADIKALMRFDDDLYSAHQYSYYMALYKNGYFHYHEAIQTIFLKIAVLSTHLRQFHLAFGIDNIIMAAIRAITGVPIFVSESEFKRIKDEELSKKAESTSDSSNEDGAVDSPHYLAVEESYAISYSQDEVASANDKYKPFELEMRNHAIELCNLAKMIDRKHSSNGLEKITILENSGFIDNPQETLRALELQIKSLFTYKAAVENLEQELDGVCLYDEKTNALINQQYNDAEQIITWHNDFVNDLEKRDHSYFKTELVDKQKYLLTKLPVINAEVEKIVSEIKDLSEHEIKRFYG